jgi:hypothetical protein
MSVRHIDPSSILERKNEDGQVRKAGCYTSEDVHRALFDEMPEPRTLEELKEGVRRRYAPHKL